MLEKFIDDFMPSVLVLTHSYHLRFTDREFVPVRPMPCSGNCNMAKVLQEAFAGKIAWTNDNSVYLFPEKSTERA